MPHGKQGDLVGLEKVPGVQIDAVGASVDLRGPVENKVNQLGREAVLLVI